MTGFRNSLTRVFNDYARKNNILKDSDQNLSGEDVREGLTAIVSVKIPNPEFEGQTKEKLGNAEAMGATQDAVRDKFFFCHFKISLSFLINLWLNHTSRKI